MLRQLKNRLLRLSPQEASFSARGFPGCRSSSRPHLERVLQTFIEGYNLALEMADPIELARELDARFRPAFAGFASVSIHRRTWPSKSMSPAAPLIG